ncbi:metalloendopeptidase [Coemansia sp. RSA 2336]|nr:metalloendopeptidase [Coemansia sp. RSA 2336]
MIRTVEKAIADYNHVLDKVEQQQAPTFSNVVAPIAYQENEFKMATEYILFLQYVSPDKTIRQACAAASHKINDFFISFDSRTRVYNSVRAVLENKEEMETLDYEDKRFVEVFVKQFERSGVLLSAQDRSQLATINARMHELESEFYTNSSEQESVVYFTKDELEGVPKEFFYGRTPVCQAGVETYAVSARHQDYADVLNYTASEDTRKKIFVANGTMCFENIYLLQEAVKYRQRMASLLGYSTFAEYMLSTQLAQTPAAVYKLQAELRDRLQSAVHQEIECLKQLKVEHMNDLGKPFTDFYDWDYSFYANRLTRSKYNIAYSDIREYLPLSNVLQGVLDLYANLLGLRIDKVEGSEAWHEGVLMYNVWDASQNELIGFAYLDLFTRPGKYNGAAVWSVRPGFKRENGSLVLPIAAMVTNFAHSTSNSPTLLDHSDVKLLLFQFGHLFHNICSKTKWSQFHGTSCKETDYVEAPSQMMENWAWEPSFLQQIAKHYQNNQPMPKSMLENLVASRQHEQGINKIGQVFMGLFDMCIHDCHDHSQNVAELYNSLQKDILLSNLGDAKVFKVATQLHLMAGYAGTYYAYIWAEVIAADMFTSRFKKDGINNRKTGMDFRREILQPGGSRDGHVSLEKFLGRKPSFDAFFKMISSV